MPAKNNTSILFFGTPAFAVPALEALIASDYSVVGVITNPDEPVGRKHIITPPPVKVLAQKHNIPIFQPEKLSSLIEEGVLPRAYLFVVAAYGKIIPKAILELPKFGTLNIHPSLLPRWRGASPIQAVILAGDADTGVTIMQIDEKMDHGAILSQETLHLGERKITYPELHDELAEIGAKLLLETIPEYLDGLIVGTPQDHTKATYCKMLTKDDGHIDWGRLAEEVERMVRGLNPWPGTWTLWQSARGAVRIRIDEASAVIDAPRQNTPGLVWQDEKRLLVETGIGSLRVVRATLEGKRSLTGEELMLGYPTLIGAVLT